MKLGCLEKHEARAGAGCIDDGIEQSIRIQLVNFVDAYYDEMKPLEVLQDAHRGSEEKSRNYFFEEIIWTIEDEVPGEQHDNHLVGVGQNCQGRLWWQDAAHNTTREGVEDGEDEAGEWVLSGKVKGIAVVVVQGDSETQALNDAMRSPKNREQREGDQCLLQHKQWL